jgi:predicted small metal-binding protein
VAYCWQLAGDVVAADCNRSTPVPTMKRNVFVSCLSAIVLTAAASFALGADKEKKQDAKSASANKEQMYTAGCPDPCSFSVQSHDKAEVTAILQQHAKSQHNMTLSEKDAQAMVKVKGAEDRKK